MTQELEGTTTVLDLLTTDTLDPRDETLFCDPRLVEGNRHSLGTLQPFPRVGVPARRTSTPSHADMRWFLYRFAANCWSARRKPCYVLGEAAD